MRVALLFPGQGSYLPGVFAGLGADADERVFASPELRRTSLPVRSVSPVRSRR
ncbi:hypothetical protein ACVNF4_10100 [Streptomyces sp. S6]